VGGVIKPLIVQWVDGKEREGKGEEHMGLL